MRKIYLLLLLGIIMSCENKEAPMPDGIEEGVLSVEGKLVKNPIGHIPSEILNYPSLKQSEKDFLVELSKKTEVSYCIENGLFDDFLKKIRENPKLKDIMLGRTKLEYDLTIDPREVYNYTYDPEQWGAEQLRTTKSSHTVLYNCGPVMTGNQSIGSLMARITVTRPAYNQPYSGASVVITLEKNPFSGAAAFVWSDTGSFANPDGNGYVRLYVRGQLETSSVAGVGGGVPFPVIVREFRVRVKGADANPGSGGPDYGGGQDDGYNDSYVGPPTMGKGYFNSSNCTGAYILVNDMAEAFSRYRCKSYQRLGSSHCIAAPSEY